MIWFRRKKRKEAQSVKTPPLSEIMRVNEMMHEVGRNVHGSAKISGGRISMSYGDDYF